MDSRIPRRISLPYPVKADGLIPRWTQLATYRSTEARCMELRIDMSSPGEGTESANNQSYPSVYVALSTGLIEEEIVPP